MLWLSGTLGALILVAVAALLSAPLWLNADAVKEPLLAQLHRSVPGGLGYQHLQLEFFPRPGLTLRDVHWVLPSRVEAQAAQVEVRLAWLPLLAGEVRVGAVQLRSPRVVLFLPEARREGERLTPETIDARLRGALNRLAVLAPGMDLEIADGELDLRPAQGPALVLRNLDAVLASRSDGIELSARATSEPVEHLGGKLRLAHEALEGRIELDLGGVRLAVLQGFLPRQPDAYGIDGKLDLRLLGTMRGASQLTVNFDASAARLQLTAAGEALTIEGAALKAVAAYARGNLNVTLDSLASKTPSLVSKGAFSAGDDGYALRLQAARLALGEWWPLFEGLAPRLAQAVRTHAVPRQGAIDIEVSARADSPGELWRPERLTAAAAFEQVALDLPRFDAAARELAGKAAYADGVLRIERLQGAVGASRIRSAELSAQLTGSTHPLQGRVDLTVQLEEALRLARGAVRAESARRQLARVRRLEGRVLAQVELNGTLQAPLAAVALSQPDFTVVHDALPYALAVSGGAARYDGRVLSAQGLAGRLGGSIFSALTGTLELRAPYRLRLTGGRADVALTELYRWLARQPAIAPRLEGYSVRRGRAAVSLASIEGALAEPGRLRYRGEAVPRDVVIRARELEDTVRLDGGALRIEPEALTGSDVSAMALGSALRIGGRLERVEDGYRLRRAEISGRLDQPLLDWLQARYDVPAQARPAVPLQLDRVRVQMTPDKAFAAQGAVQSPDGVRLEFDLRSEADGRVELNRVALRDAESDATVRVTLGERRVRAAFTGALTAASVRRLLPAAPVPFRTLSGDIAFDLDRDSPRASRALGRLQGEGIDAPLPATVPWRIERFSLEADGALLRIDSARIEGPGTDAVLSGTVASAEDRYLVDLLLQGKSIVAPAWGGQKADAGQAPASDADARGVLPRLLAADLPVWGSVRVHLDRVGIGQFEVMPLLAAGTLESGRLDLVVQRAALCGIALKARLTAGPSQARLEGELSSRGARLEASVPCLTERRIAATGGFDMDVRFASEGPPALLLDRMQGDFQLDARDGRILAFTTLNRVFAVLNVTEAVRGRLPDLSREGMAFKSAQTKGRIEGSRLLFEHGVLDAETVTLAAQGQTDLAAGTLDLDLLVAPLKTVDAVVRRVPILGRVLGGTLVAIPVRIRGTVTDPAVVPLAPQAVAARLLGILGNTLKLPVDLLDALGTAGQAPQGAR
ncbi:MAG TPA: AsmA-like C-terminal domain-containing protein [Burkholderiales bacterium]